MVETWTPVFVEEGHGVEEADITVIVMFEGRDRIEMNCSCFQFVGDRLFQSLFSGHCGAENMRRLSGWYDFGAFFLLCHEHVFFSSGECFSIFLPFLTEYV